MPKKPTRKTPSTAPRRPPNIDTDALMSALEVEIDRAASEAIRGALPLSAGDAHAADPQPAATAQPASSGDTRPADLPLSSTTLPALAGDAHAADPRPYVIALPAPAGDAHAADPRPYVIALPAPAGDAHAADPRPYVIALPAPAGDAYAADPGLAVLRLRAPADDAHAADPRPAVIALPAPAGDAHAADPALPAAAQLVATAGGHPDNPEPHVAGQPEHLDDRDPPSLSPHTVTGAEASSELPSAQAQTGDQPPPISGEYQELEPSQLFVFPTPDPMKRIEDCAGRCTAARQRRGLSEKESLALDIEAYLLVHELGGAEGSAIQERLGNHTPRKGTSPYFYVVQLLTGRSVNDGGDAKEVGAQKAEVSRYARFFTALDNFKNSAGALTQSDILKQVMEHGGVVKFTKQHAPTTRGAGRGSDDADPEEREAALAVAKRAAADRMPLCTFDDAEGLIPAAGDVVLALEGRLYRADKRLLTLIMNTLPDMPADIPRAPNAINTFAELLAIGATVPDGGRSDVPIQKGDDPARPGTVFMLTARNLRWKIDHAVITQSRKRASVIVHVRPLTAIRLPQADLFALAGDRRKVEKLFASVALDQYEHSEARDTNAYTDLIFPPRDKGKVAKLRFRPISLYGKDRPDDSWLLDISDECNLISGEAIATEASVEQLRQQLGGRLKGTKAAKQELQLGISGSKLSMKFGTAKAIEVPVERKGATRAVTVKVAAEDFVPALQWVLDCEEVKSLSLAADPTGVLQLKFSTQLNDATVFIPVLVEGRRAQRLLKPYYPALSSL
jgi:hypothetical protein